LIYDDIQSEEFKEYLKKGYPNGRGVIDINK